MAQPVVDSPTAGQPNMVQMTALEPMVAPATEPVMAVKTDKVPEDSTVHMPAVSEGEPQEAEAAAAEVLPVEVVTAAPPAQDLGPQFSYRAEMPLVSALPAQLRQSDLAMLGDLHKRMGDEASDAGNDLRAWGRFVRADANIRQTGTVAPQSRGHLDGFQVGHDVYANQGAKAGLYLGQLQGTMGVDGLANGGERSPAGFNRLQSRYLGAYGTWQDAEGSYADGVVQRAGYRSQMHAADGRQARVKGDGWLASLEVGKAFAIDSQWQIEPQAQIVYRHLRLEDTALGMATVQHQVRSDWTLRLGMRIKARLDTSAGQFQPYGRINVYKASGTTDASRFITPVATTDIRTQGGYTTTELAAGGTLQLNQRTRLYGEVGQRWAHGGDARVKGGLQASAGLRLHW
jgi:outer membrane autotransporter protein